MSNMELLMAGLKLLIFGMGMVYIFLTIMIIVMKVLQKVLAPYADMLEPKQAAPAAARKRPVATDDVALAAAASVAVQVAVRGGNGLAAAPAAAAAPAVSAAPAQARTVRSPLPGTVMKVLVQPGTEVAAGETVVVIEAMKMETEIKADHAGVVASVDVEAGQVVAVEDPLFELEDK